MDKGKYAHEEVDPRFVQAAKEAWACIVLAALNFLWWFATAYGLGTKPVDQYAWIWGLPAWFMWSCVFGLPLFVLFIFVAVRTIFKEVPLEAHTPSAEQEEGRWER
ncbi:MAG: YhdT family protein [Thermodesulfobacteriota bacterium]